VVPDEYAWSRDEELVNAHSAADNVYIVQVEGLWPSEHEKRTALLELARATYTLEDGEDLWALVLDADETLANGKELRDFIAFAGHSDQAPGLQRIEPDGASYWAPSRLILVTPSTVYLPGDVLRSDEYGETSTQHRLFPSSPGANAHVRHHWDRRSNTRLRWRLRHGAWLARSDGLEAA
jgi:hypothetical protein